MVLTYAWRAVNLRGSPPGGTSRRDKLALWTLRAYPCRLKHGIAAGIKGYTAPPKIFATGGTPTPSEKQGLRVGSAMSASPFES